MVKDRLAELQEKHVADIIAKDTEESTEDDVPEMVDRSLQKTNWKGKKYSQKLAVNEFLRHTRIIEDNLKCLRRELNEINRLQSNLQFSPFKEEDDIHNLQEMGKNFLLRAGKLKTDIEDLPNKSSCNQQSDMQQRVQRNQIQRLTTMLRDLVIEFKTNQGNCIGKSKSMCRKQREIVCGSLNADDASHLEDDLENQQLFTGNYISELTQARGQLQSIRVRERELLELEGQIVELNDIFKTMQILVVEQGANIDTIEHNVNKSADYIHVAEKNLEIAVEEKRKYNKRLIIIITIVVIVVTVLAIIIGVTVNQNS
jgi:t-SNARE complex subunit (syntaxin)